jgi:hypothetical protein
MAAEMCGVLRRVHQCFICLHQRCSLFGVNVPRSACLREHRSSMLNTHVTYLPVGNISFPADAWQLASMYGCLHWCGSMGMPGLSVVLIPICIDCDRWPLTLGLWGREGMPWLDWL